jgi:homoserine O-acetyltransferase/O-succinyltransferase
MSNIDSAGKNENGRRNELVISPKGFVAHLGEDEPLLLKSGKKLTQFQIAYQIYGKLNPDKSNAILICHALTGDQFVASQNPYTIRGGWWEEVVGPGKVINTDNYFVICSNVLGGCMGSSGPTSKTKNGKPYGMRFPIVNIADMASAQQRLVKSLGIRKLLAVVGGSMGGMQTLAWLHQFPHFMNGAVVISTSFRNSTQNIAFNEVGRQSIVSDPEWCEGRYFEHGAQPIRGLSVARMLAHITYLSPQGLHQKFGRRLQTTGEHDIRHGYAYDFKQDFQIESYLNHQGSTFVKRFDANSYLYLSKAMDYFDLEQDAGGDLVEAFEQGDAKIFVATFSSDWLFTAEESRIMVDAMRDAGRNVEWTEFESKWGHDAFLLRHEKFWKSLREFLESLQGKN